MRAIVSVLALWATLWCGATAQAYDVVDKPLKGRTFDRVKVKIGGFVQPRFRFQQGDEAANTDGYLGFSVQRARLEVEGHFLPPEHRHFGFHISQKYSLELVGKNGATLQDAYVNMGFGTEFQLRVGQFKATVHRANQVSDANNLFPDRNRITQFSGMPNRDIGAMIHGHWGGKRPRQIAWNLGVYNGEGENRAPANQSLLYVARVVFSPWGSPGDSYEILKDWRAPGDDRYIPSLSLGYSFHTNTDGVPGTQQLFLGHNAELFFHWRFLTIMSEFFYRQVDWEDVNIEDYDQLGWYVQAGAFLMGVPWAQDHVALMFRAEQGDEFIPTGPNVPPAGPRDPGQETRRYAVGLGLYGGKPLFDVVQEFRVVLSYTIKEELEGFPLDDDEFNVSMNLTF